MKQLLYSLLICFALLTACKEEEDPIISPPANSVTIGNTDYATVKIGSQTWTAVNYAGPGGMKYDATDTKPEYGKYYTYEEAKNISLPTGWRIPTMQDYANLAQTQNIAIPAYKNETIKTLTSTTNWKNVRGTNISGFNAHPTGYIFINSAPLDGDIAEFWTAEGKTLSIQEGGDMKSLRILFYDNSSSPDYRFTVRFVKD
jgi:uncharacterized protein (TIGR02145 family)